MVRVWVESRRKELPPKLSHRVIIGDLREVAGHLWMWIHSFIPSYLHLFLHLFCCCFLFFLFFIFFFFFFFRFLVLSIHLQSRLLNPLLSDSLMKLAYIIISGSAVQVLHSHHSLSTPASLAWYFPTHGSCLYSTSSVNIFNDWSYNTCRTSYLNGFLLYILDIFNIIIKNAL